ncbi:GNAT family N-acetyltransferase [Nakamurella lactea]|uniref:GNAT family N-acetyltransferase n=1 Tax=Nakamurella lactea TaxID=459515 RepID=UPI0004214967|nr:GNAT family N-acetyltransferase [Nakamurella lactea]
MSDVEVTDNSELHRFEARLDGALAGFAVYRREPGRIVFVHTEVDPAFEGRGIGGALARQALDGLRDDGTVQVVAECPFIAAWIQRHPDYQELLRPRP